MKSEEKKEIREAGKDPGTESTKVRGCSSVGRAPALQAGGQGFESLHLHSEYISEKEQQKPWKLKLLSLIGVLPISNTVLLSRWMQASVGSITDLLL